MGLDQYAYAVKQSYDADKREQTTVKTEIFSWRKHNALEGYMAELYAAKTGDESEFNCKTLKLVESDLNELQRAVENQQLPETQGMFFGENSQFDEEQQKWDLKFIEKARDYIKEGHELEYTSWW